MYRYELVIGKEVQHEDHNNQFKLRLKQMYGDRDKYDTVIKYISIDNTELLLAYIDAIRAFNREPFWIDMDWKKGSGEGDNRHEQRQERAFTDAFTKTTNQIPDEICDINDLCQEMMGLDLEWEVYPSCELFVTVTINNIELEVNIVEVE